MIGIRLEGGLGNQMFQYAAGRALANQIGCDLVLDQSALFTRNKKTTTRNLELNHFKIAGRVAFQNEFGFSRLLFRLRLQNLRIGRWKVIIDRRRGYDSRLLHQGPDTYLCGYWQSFKYFKNAAALIQNDFTPIGKFKANALSLQNKIAETTSIAIHVRRSDYVTLKSAAQFHGVLDLSYYNRAITYMNSKVLHPKYFIFSDDPKWCRENLPIPSSSFVSVSEETNRDAWEDLLLMSQCKHLIIANSSFSWWGAWLSCNRRNKCNNIVVAPQKWFSGKHYDDFSDRIPEEWFRI
jgi:hypothetical protein